MTNGGVAVKWKETVTLFTQFTHESFGLAFLMEQKLDASMKAIQEQ